MTGLNLSHWEDSIVALSTPPGVGALAIIRISGPKSFHILEKMAPGSKPVLKSSHQAFLTKLYWNTTLLDEALVTIFKNPRSFTGEDTVEISLHGSPFIVSKTLEAALDAGARLAKPGEFTQRAFLNKKLDLTQAEAVGDLISSESAAAHRAALHQLKGGLSKEIGQLRQQLIDFAALVELELDFSEEDVEFADRNRLRELVIDIQNHISRLLESFSSGQAVRNGIPIVIVGPPNAGKSTLLNALLQEEKAIVSPIAGTTRDVIEDTLIISGIQFRFVDTAGLRDARDEIERIGIERTRQQLDKASFALLLQAPDSEVAEIDAIEAEILSKKIPHLRVYSKSDIHQPTIENGFFISAATGIGIDNLKNKILESAVDKQMLEGENAIITNLRHFEALSLAHKALFEVLAALQQGLSGDLLATEIREALFHLGSITGEITVEDVLGSIFSRFCIGK